MEWFIVAAPIPGPVEFTIGGGAVLAVLLAVVLTPIVVVARHALGLHSGAAEAPQLRVIEGGKEARPQAA